jgi:hypothetical protein
MSDIEPTEDEVTEDDGADDTAGHRVLRSQPPREGEDQRLS